MTAQYPRKVGLIVSEGDSGIDLSEMHIQFKVTQQDASAPNTAEIRVFNLKDDTAQRIQNEYQHVALQAGYDGGQFGKIFEGTIKQVRRGKVNATDTFVDILAADGDKAYNFAVVTKSLAAGSTLADRAKAVGEATAPLGTKMGDTSSLFGGTLPRGRVLFALGREEMDNISDSGNVSWSIQNGEVVLVSDTGYLSGEAVVLNSLSGMVGVPEATNDGILVTCLLNPLLRIGGRVQIDNKSINTTNVREQGYPRYTDITYIAQTSNDGFYRVLVIDHEGDNRANPFYSKLICLAVDPSSKPDNSVKAYG